jgi:ribosome-associated protein
MRETTPLLIGDGVSIPRHELVTKATRAGGAGGQHVNTSSTRIELLWNVQASIALSDEMKARVLEKLANRVDATGTIRVVASQRRSQLQNRELAEERLAELVRQALVVPKRRRPTKPGAAARAARLDSKRRQSIKKRERRRGGVDD